MNLLELKNGTKIKYQEYYSFSGVSIIIMEPVTPEQKIEITKTLKEERDLLSIKFQK